MSSSQQKLACKGTLRQVFLTLYRLEIQAVMSAFSTQLCELFAPLTFSLVRYPPSPPPLLCVNKYCIHTVYT